MPSPLEALSDDELRRRGADILGYEFDDLDLLEEALTHTSIADNRLDSNERMEFLGDAVLDLAVCEDIYARFPDLFEGDLTKIKSAVVSRRTCAEVAVETGLAGLLSTGKGIVNRGGMPASLAANVYEAVVAAIHLDGGFDAARAYVLRTMGPKIEEVSASLHQFNYKAALQQEAQRTLGGTPYYELLDEKGPEHSKCFEVCVTVNGRRFESAWGTNKKIAEQKAALRALEELGALTAEEAETAAVSLQLAEPAA